MGITSAGSFILCNYDLYFKQKNTTPHNLSRDARRSLECLILLSEEKVDDADFYAKTLEQYGVRMQELVERCIKDDFKSVEGLTIIGSLREDDENDSRATITDSYDDDLDKLEENLIEN